MITDLLLDGLFAAIAAIGFGSISNVPVKAFWGCALLAALGHATRFFLMNVLLWNIIPAATVAAIVIGLCTPILSKYMRTPAESLAYPALLPMIPGMYAYRAVAGMLLCMKAGQDETLFNHALYLFCYNGFVCTFIIVFMVLGVTIPIHISQKYIK